jgi:DNA-directed RNA polymerase subunit RPC12/RpoP
VDLMKCVECNREFEPSEMTDVDGTLLCEQCAGEILEGQTGVVIARYLCSNCLESFDATQLLELDGEYFCESCRDRRTRK